MNPPFAGACVFLSVLYLSAVKSQTLKLNINLVTLRRARVINYIK